MKLDIDEFKALEQRFLKLKNYKGDEILRDAEGKCLTSQERANAAAMVLLISGGYGIEVTNDFLSYELVSEV